MQEGAIHDLIDGRTEGGEANKDTNRIVHHHHHLASLPFGSAAKRVAILNELNEIPARRSDF